MLCPQNTLKNDVADKQHQTRMIVKMPSSLVFLNDIELHTTKKVILHFAFFYARFNINNIALAFHFWLLCKIILLLANVFIASQFGKHDLICRKADLIAIWSSSLLL